MQYNTIQYYVTIDPLHFCRNAANLEYRTIRFLYRSDNLFCFVLQIDCIPTAVQGVYTVQKHYKTLYYNAIQSIECNTLHYNTIQKNITIHYNAMQIQYNAIQYDTIQSVENNTMKP